MTAQDHFQVNLIIRQDLPSVTEAVVTGLFVASVTDAVVTGLFVAEAWQKQSLPGYF